MPRNQQRINSEIRRKEVRLIDENGTHVGVVSLREALAMAEEANLDLVEVSPDATPSVCKILNHSKEMYERKKRQSNSNKNRQSVKEIKISRNIGQADLERKINETVRHLQNGNKVLLTIMSKGRELSYWDAVQQMLYDVCENIENEVECRVDLPKHSKRPTRNLTASITHG